MWVPPHRLCAHPSSAPYCVIAWSSYTRVLVPHGYMRGRMAAPTGCRAAAVRGVCLHVGSSAEHQVLLPSEPVA